MTNGEGDGDYGPRQGREKIFLTFFDQDRDDPIIEYEAQSLHIPTEGQEVILEETGAIAKDQNGEVLSSEEIDEIESEDITFEYDKMDIGVYEVDDVELRYNNMKLVNYDEDVGGVVVQGLVSVTQVEEEDDDASREAGR